MPVYLAFGDSNTHGTKPSSVPDSFERWGRSSRWVRIAHAALPDDWDLAEEGLPGRTTQFEDPIMGAHMNGVTGLKIALMTHAPISLVSIMLGTNDVKSRQGVAPEQCASGIACLIDIIRHPEMEARTGQPKILVIAPPPVNVTDDRAAEWTGATEKSMALSGLYRTVAAAYGAEFLDAADYISVAEGEGIHFDEAAHHSLGRAVGSKLAEMID
ncbi:MAG: GDSL-type esterase/lipase family protein [Pseudomonadota bacterium]